VEEAHAAVEGQHVRVRVAEPLALDRRELGMPGDERVAAAAERAGEQRGERDAQAQTGPIPRSAVIAAATPSRDP
jgi:hypothetical protein